MIVLARQLWLKQQLLLSPVPSSLRSPFRTPSRCLRLKSEFVTVMMRPPWRPTVASTIKPYATIATSTCMAGAVAEWHSNRPVLFKLVCLRSCSVRQEPPSKSAPPWRILYRNRKVSRKKSSRKYSTNMPSSRLLSMNSENRPSWLSSTLRVFRSTRHHPRISLSRLWAA